MAEYVKRDDVWQMLHGIGGCGAEPESRADGWDKAIDTAISELEELPTVELAERNGIYLKPCPFCGEKNITSEFTHFSGGFKYSIGCKSCNLFINALLYTDRADPSLDKILQFSKRAADKWNTRYSENSKDESEVEENA